MDDRRTDEPAVVRRASASFYERTPFASMILDLTHRRVLDVNAACERLLGLDSSRILGRPARDFLSDEIPEELLRRRGLRGQVTWSFRTVRTGDGDRMCLVAYAPTDDDGVVCVQAVDLEPIVPDDATVVGAVGAVEVQSAPVALLVVDAADHRVTAVNRAAADLLSGSPGALVGVHVDDLVADPGEGLPIVTDTDDVVRLPSRAIVGVDGPVDVRMRAVPATTSVVVALLPRRRTARRRWTGPARPAARPDTSSRPARLRTVCAAALVALGAVVLVVGWWLGVESVTVLAPGLSSMKANTAACLMGLGAGLALVGRGRWRFLPLAVVAVLASGTLAESLLDVDLGVDDLLATDTFTDDGSTPGRMGLNTATAFVLLAAGQALDTVRRAGALIASQLVTLAAMIVAGLGFLGYVFGASGEAGLASSTEMALHTAVGALAAGVGALTVTQHGGVLATVTDRRGGGRFARRILPLGLGSVVLAGFGVEALTAAGVVEQPEMRLAVFSMSILVLAGVVIATIAGTVNDLDSKVDDARRDLDTVLAAFADRHYRVSATDEARLVTGSTVTSSLPVDGLVPATERRNLAHALRSARADRVEATLSFAVDGRHLELRVAPLTGEEVAVSVRDTSELAAARDDLAALTANLEDQVAERTAELHVANEHLARTNADLEQFAYLASHDLQEPLRMVSAFVEKLADRLGDDLDDRSRTYVEYATDGAARMSQLIDGLLQYSRAGRVEVDAQPVALGPLVDQVVQTLRGRAEEVGATVVVDPDLPAVAADPVLLRQIVQNLVANALKFVTDERPPEVQVSATRAGTVVEVSVTDNGIGIAPEYRSQIFQVFRRLHGRGTYAGTGIGLSLVQRLVESHGGRVWVDDRHPGPGTRFTFTLPAADPPGSA